MLDNDCNGLIDCTDPACAPATCEGGAQDGQSCETDPAIMACTQGQGVCLCPTIKKDPTTIRFGRPGELDKFTSHGQILVPNGVDLTKVEVGVLLSNARGGIFAAVLPAGFLTPNMNGTSFRYRNVMASRMGGLLKVRIRVVGQAYRYWIEAYSDLSAALDPNMAIQIYFGGQRTSAIHEEDWTRMRYGWKATGLRSR
jgi:hypothetical protein